MSDLCLIFCLNKLQAMVLVLIILKFLSGFDTLILISDFPKAFFKSRGLQR